MAIPRPFPLGAGRCPFVPFLTAFAVGEEGRRRDGEGASTIET